MKGVVNPKNTYAPFFCLSFPTQYCRGFCTLQLMLVLKQNNLSFPKDVLKIIHSFMVDLFGRYFEQTIHASYHALFELKAFGDDFVVIHAIKPVRLCLDKFETTLWEGSSCVLYLRLFKDANHTFIRGFHFKVEFFSLKKTFQQVVSKGLLMSNFLIGRFCFRLKDDKLIKVSARDRKSLTDKQKNEAYDFCLKFKLMYEVVIK